MYYLINDTVKQNAIAAIRDLLACEPAQWIVDIRPYKKNKTHAQRAYFHKIIQLVSEATGYDKEELKLKIKYRVLPLVTVEVDGKMYQTPISSEKATREQYSELIEAAKMLAHSAEVSIPQPEYCGFKIN